MNTHHANATAVDVKEHLEVLESERALAGLMGLDANPLYAEDLATELAATRAAYVGVAVTEIASLRALLHGPLQG